jgi:hypothetical protein
MNGFGPISDAQQQPLPDPTKHVLYTQGMVLGVDDFVQEYAYLAERDQWGVRDLVGYGTSWGLGVTMQLGAQGPEVMVAPGVAVTPRGRLVRVTPAQCAPLNPWLARNAAAVQAQLGLSPVQPALTVYVVLCYRECQTDLLPLPGEPCRADDQTRAPSRLTDDFRLELRFAPPDQSEENAIRDFARWLRLHIEPAPEDASSIPLDAFLAAIRDAVVPSSPPDGSPPSSPPDYFLDDSPGGPLAVAPADLCRYLQAAYGLWVTELRPRFRPNWLGDGQGCRGPITPPAIDDADCVLLAAAELELVRELDGGPWKVAEDGVTIDESSRPLLLSLRLVQELLTCGPCCGGGGPAISPPEIAPAQGALPRAIFAMPRAAVVGAGPQVVAAGHLRGDGTALAPTFNNLRRVTSKAGRLVVTFDNFKAPDPGDSRQYIVKVLAGVTDDAEAALVQFGGYDDGSDGSPPGIVLLVRKGGASMPLRYLNDIAFMVEVTEYGA